MQVWVTVTTEGVSKGGVWISVLGPCCHKYGGNGGIGVRRDLTSIDVRTVGDRGLHLFRDKWSGRSSDYQG